MVELKRLVVDAEANGLNPTKIWCVVTIDVDTEVVKVWRYDQCNDRFADCSDLWIGHNIIGYDAPILSKLSNTRINFSACIDTLVCSRLFNFQLREHSLDAWGERLGLPKGNFDEWDAYDDPDLERDRMDRCVKYCIQDCRITLALFKLLESSIYSDQWKRSLRCEHDMAELCREMKNNGFKFDVTKAQSIYDELRRTVESLSQDLSRAFLPRSKLIREIIPKATKFGTLHRGDFRWDATGDLSAFSPGAAFSRFEYEPFNPGSPKQVIERLNEAGWQPFEKTDGYKDAEKELRELSRISGKKRREADIQDCKEKLKDYEIYGWKISEENLSTLPEDAPYGCSLFVKWRMLTKRLQTLEEWFQAYNEQTGRIHGTFNHIGAWTHRMSHSEPNMGNVPSIDSKYHSDELKALAKNYGISMRSCWIIPNRRRLVGVDAEGIQLRILAHYMNDEEFTQALISGKKDDRYPELSTDVHTLNAIKLGFDFTVRPRAKTFIYAWLLGAGLGKVAKILGITLEAARVAVEACIRGYPGLLQLKTVKILVDAERGYFEGFDGRLIRSDEYHMLAGYLQAGEQCIMKHAKIKWEKELKKLGIDYLSVDMIHDEWQTEVPDDQMLAETVAFIQMDSIRWIGEEFGLNCPLAGSRKIGNNWMETH